MQISTALSILGLRSPFTLLELKAAYRKAALKTHPDCGGTEAGFHKVDNAYDFLKSLASDKATADSFIATYWENRLSRLEEKFKQEWRKAHKKARKEKLGLWYRTCFERFSRAYLEPRPEWFIHCLFGSKVTFAEKEEYRTFLLSVAPNKRFAEPWALKYYRLEFGQDAPWVFYLPGSLQRDEVSV